MRGMFRFKSNSAMSMAIAAGLAATLLVASTAPAEAQRRGGGNSKEFVAAATPLQERVQNLEKLRDGGASEAELNAGVVEATPYAEAAVAAASNPQDKVLAGQFLVSLGGMNGDLAMRKRGVQLMLDSGRLDAAQVPQFHFYLGNFAYGSKDYETAARALKTASDLGHNDDQLVPLMMQAYGQAGRAQEGLAAAREAMDARKAAGQPIPQDWISRANVVAYNAKLGSEAMSLSMLLVQEYPTNFNWLASTQMVRTFATLDPQATLDLFRLMDRSGALDNDPQYVSNEYKEYIETADPRKNPGEVADLISRAIAKGKLDASDTWVAESRTNAAGRIAADKASLPGLVREAKSSANGRTAVIAGDVALNYGESAQAVEMYELALQKGGAEVDLAQMRLGIALFDMGNHAAANEAFAKVGGARKAIADLWQVLIASKARASAS